MTERLADLGARIDGIRQLGAVVGAMRGIAAARAQQARNQLAAVDSYADTIARAIGRTLALVPAAPPATNGPARRALVLFCAEQGFAGAFSEHVLDAIPDGLPPSCLFLVGTRGRAVASERHIVPGWSIAVPSHSPGIPKLADGIADALYARISKGEIDQLDTIFGQWESGHGLRIERRRLFPLDLAAFSLPAEQNAPLLNLPPEALLVEFTSAYLRAQLCNAALHAFAAENQARMEAMASAHRHIERQLAGLRATERILRQEEITAEIIELAAGDTASRAAP